MTITVKSFWKVWLRNPDGETATIEIEGAINPLNAKIMGIDQYDRAGWYAVEAVLIQTRRSES